MPTLLCHSTVGNAPGYMAYTPPSSQRMLSQLGWLRLEVSWVTTRQTQWVTQRMRKTHGVES